jgi:hypothetical protein
MFNILSYKRNTNNTEIPYHPRQNDNHQKKSADESVEKKKSLYTVGGDVNLYNH